MVICSYQKSMKIGCSEPHMNHNNTVLESVESKRLLGVIIGNHWKAHINDLGSNLSKHIALCSAESKCTATSNKDSIL